ncbi:Fe-S cluster assembly protein SufD [bacterium]|nr:Fe-S cluster assembly protein SufD [bacterium]
MAIATGSAKDHFIAEYLRMEPQLMGADVDWIRSMRRKALDRFNALGLPGAKDEEWRFTNLEALENTVFASPDPARTYHKLAGDAAKYFIPGLDAHRFVFMNGVYQPEISDVGELPAGVRLMTVGEAIGSGDRVFRENLGRCAEDPKNPFTALNSAWLQNGVFVHVPDGCVIEKPMHVVFLATAGAQPLAFHSRNLAVVGRAAQITIIGTYGGLGEGVYLTNGVTEMAIGEDAQVDHYKVQLESPGAFHVHSMYARQARSSNLRTHAFAIGGALSRQNVNVTLAGEGTETVLNGLYAISGTQHADAHTRLDHAVPHCHSTELYKGILDDHASGVFTGRIVVRPDAQKTDAYQRNRALLLSDSAVVNAQPQLEIFADDVKCTHGAAVGQLDSEAAFYLRSRGIGLEEARALLTFAFAGEVLDQVRAEALKNELGRIISEKFHAHNPLAEALI